VRRLSDESIVEGAGVVDGAADLSFAFDGIHVRPAGPENR
jgi:hypothetical protein